MARANTNGVEMPAEFPTSEFNAVHAALVPCSSTYPEFWTECMGGWNAVAIRFKTMADADDVFTKSFSQSTAPPSDERYNQEAALFSFFVAGYAVIESFAYSLYVVGAMLRQRDFPMNTPQSLKTITPQVTRDKFAAHFPGTDIELQFSSLLADETFRNWGLIRNVLAHRSAPPRHYKNNVTATPTGLVVGSATQSESTWQIVSGGLTLNNRTTRDKRMWLATRLSSCVRGVEAFVTTNFS